MKRLFVSLLSVIFASTVMAESITYRIIEYNKSVGDFTLLAFGEKPRNSYAFFENEYGATTGNRYNQIPRNKQASLKLEGWHGCTINSVTLWMCSNNDSGQAALEVNAGERNIFKMSARDFSDEEWFGHWVSKDLNTFVEITKQMTVLSPVAGDEEVDIRIKGGTSEGSVYVDAITIDYTPGSGISMESPMGYVYEKMEAKATLNDGDVVIMYRSGDAAGDIDGMEKSHYLDAIGVASTSSVNDPAIEVFTANTTADNHWTITDQYGRKLGARKVQSLAWDEGVTTWDIKLGYDGATIASTNTNYGTMRYNAPSGSYPRFWNYTSNTLSLPYLYRQVRQQQPTVSTLLTLAYSSREVSLEETDTLVIKHTLQPSTVTDNRVAWSSSDESVATVKSGVVSLKGIGTTTITATSFDGGSSVTCILTVASPTSIEHTTISSASSVVYYSIDGRKLKTMPRKGIFVNDKGKKMIK